MAFFLPRNKFLENIGTKTAEKAPSAVILLKIFGNLKATKNASATRLMPNTLLIRTSLISPVILLIKVRLATIKVDLKREFFLSTDFIPKISLKSY